MACWDLAGKAWGVPCWQMLGGKFRDRIRVYADTPADLDPVKMGNRLKARMERGFTFLKMDVSVNQLKGVEGGLTYPKGQGTDPFDQYSRSDVRAAAPPLHRHPDHGEGAQGAAGVRGHRPRDRRLGDPDRHRPLRPLRHRGRDQAGPGPRPVQPRVARGHGALAVHGPVRPAEERRARRPSSPARTSTSRRASGTSSRRRPSRSATPTSPPPGASSRPRRSATSRWSTGSAWPSTWPATR